MKIATVMIIALAELAAVTTMADAAECISPLDVVKWIHKQAPDAKIVSDKITLQEESLETHIGEWTAIASFENGCMTNAGIFK